MGGFLGGLGEILGGFNAARRIDKEGFDFREAQAQENFRRQREQELARQEDEDRGLSQLGDVLAAQEQPDVEGAISSMPGQVDQARRGWMAKVALGQLPERKSRLEASKSYARLAEQQLKGQQAAQQIELRGDESESLARMKADIEAGRKPSPRDEYIADQASKRTGMTIDAMLKRASMGGVGGRGALTKVPGVDEGGRAGTWTISRSGVREFFPAGPTAATRGKTESRGAAMDAFNELMGIYDSIGGQPQGGIEARTTGFGRRASAAAGYDPETRAYQAGVRGFVPLMARALGHVGVLTELDVERTEALFPGPGDTEAEKQLKVRMLQDIMSGARPLPFRFESESQGGAIPNAAPTAPTGKVRRRFNPATGEFE